MPIANNSGLNISGRKISSRKHPDVRVANSFPGPALVPLEASLGKQLAKLHRAHFPSKTFCLSRFLLCRMGNLDESHGMWGQPPTPCPPINPSRNAGFAIKDPGISIGELGPQYLSSLQQAILTVVAQEQAGLSVLVHINSCNKINLQ